MGRHNWTYGACEMYPGHDYTPDEVVFIRGMDYYKRTGKLPGKDLRPLFLRDVAPRPRPFPAWREVLAVLERLGWIRVTAAERRQLGRLRSGTWRLRQAAKVPRRLEVED